MNRPGLLRLMTWIFLVLAVVCFWQGARYFFLVRSLQRAQGELATIELFQIAVRNLAQDCVDYGRVNPAIDPLLQRFDIKLPPSQPATSTPAARNNSR